MSLKDIFGNMGSFFGLEAEEGEDTQEVVRKKPQQQPKQVQPKQQRQTRVQQAEQRQPQAQRPQQQPKPQKQRSERAMPKETARSQRVEQRRPQNTGKSTIRQPQGQSKIVDMQAAERKNPRTRERMQDSASTIMVLEPRVYSEAMKIANHVMSGKSVLVNFNLMEEYQARRVVDFLTGTVYAEDGDIKRVSDEMFLCTPKTVEIEGAAKSLVQNDLFDLNEMSL